MTAGEGGSRNGGPFTRGFANADDCCQSTAMRRLGFVVNQNAQFAVIRTTLGMPDNNGTGTGILKHFGGQIASMSTLHFRVAVLATHIDGAVLEADGQNRQERRRWTNENINVDGRRTQSVANLGRFTGRGSETVHLPIAGNQWLNHVNLDQQFVRTPKL